MIKIRKECLFVFALLAFAAGELAGAAQARVDIAAAAVELIHAYSLVHDDMPCMDNDVLRRGKPTVHVAFDEATAMLAGDALQAEAFKVLAEGQLPAPQTASLMRELAHASGTAGMCGGQALDLVAVGNMDLTLAELERIGASSPVAFEVTFADGTTYRNRSDERAEFELAANLQEFFGPLVGFRTHFFSFSFSSSSSRTMRAAWSTPPSSRCSSST